MITACGVPVRRPLVLRAVTAQEAALSRYLHRALSTAVDIGGRAWTARLARIDREPDHVQQFSLHWGGTVKRFAVTQTDLQRLLAPWLGTVSIEAAGPALRDAMLHDVAAALAHRLGVALGYVAAPGDRSTPAAGTPDRSNPRAQEHDHVPARPRAPGALCGAPWVQIGVTTPGDSAALWIQGEGLMPAALDAWWLARADDTPFVQQLPIRVRIEHGWLSLSLSQLRRLRPGDALAGATLGGIAAGTPLVIRLAPALGIPCVFQANGSAIATSALTMIHEPHSDDLHDDHDDPPPIGERPVGPRSDTAEAALRDERHAARTLVDSVPIHLTFDLGTHSLSVAQLRTVGVGYVFDLGLQPHCAVTLRANGARIGAGELVDIDGRVGVAITHLELDTL